jgi:hypothetical protein
MPMPLMPFRRHYASAAITPFFAAADATPIFRCHFHSLMPMPLLRRYCCFSLR